MGKATAEAKPKKPEGIRNLTEAEISEMHNDTSLPPGYSNTTLGDAEPESAGAKAPAAAPAPEPAAAAPAEVAADPAGGEPAAKKVTAPDQEDTFVKIEREMAKPEGSEDLGSFSPREKAYFHQMRRDRKARQKAEEERDAALFREGKLKKDAEAKPDSDPYDGRAEDDILTVKDAKEILKKQREKVAAPAAPEAPPAQVASAKRYLTLCEKEAREKHADFDVVMELSDDLISNSPDALKEISEQTQRGENPAEVMYSIIKKQKDFDTLLPVAETRLKARKAAAPASPASPSAPAPATPEDKAKIDKATQAEKALEDNAGKTKTTAHVSAREGKPAAELTLEEIGAMSDMEFAKLPRHVRQRYLKEFGG